MSEEGKTQVEEKGPEDLLTIQEASDYLKVSQPTLFRWMKQGWLSFYKIGGATRFTREGLNAVVEKTTGLKEAEAAAGCCARCGHSVLVEGTLQGTGKLYFRPVKTKFWTLSEALVPTKSLVCTACGYLQMSVDVDKLSRLTPEKSNNNKEAGHEDTKSKRRIHAD